MFYGYSNTLIILQSIQFQLLKQLMLRSITNENICLLWQVTVTPLPLRNQVNLEDALFHKAPENEEFLPLSMFYSHFQTFVYKCTHAMMGETANNLFTKKKFF